MSITFYQSFFLISLCSVLLSANLFWYIYFKFLCIVRFSFIILSFLCNFAYRNRKEKVSGRSGYGELLNFYVQIVRMQRKNFLTLVYSFPFLFFFQNVLTEFLKKNLLPFFFSFLFLKFAFGSFNSFHKDPFSLLNCVKFDFFY